MRNLSLHPRAAFARPRIGAALGALFLLFPGASHAALGGSQSAIDAEQAHMKAARRVVSHGAAYQVHELSMTSGGTVREFVDASGTIFAVAWRGPFRPDLKSLLGPHYQRFLDAGAVRHADHRRLAVHANDLVIESSGRMRAFSGRAYLPGFLPAGVSVNEIQ